MALKHSQNYALINVMNGLIHDLFLWQAREPGAKALGWRRKLKWEFDYFLFVWFETAIYMKLASISKVNVSFATKIQNLWEPIFEGDIYNSTPARGAQCWFALRLLPFPALWSLLEIQLCTHITYFCHRRCRGFAWKPRLDVSFGVVSPVKCSWLSRCRPWFSL